MVRSTQFLSEQMRQQAEDFSSGSFRDSSRDSFHDSSILAEWMSKKYLSPAFLSFAKKQFLANSPFPHYVLRNFLRPKKARALKVALLAFAYERKESDLFSFLQSTDLRSSTVPLIRSFVAFYSSPAFFLYISLVTDEKNVRGVDLSAFIYARTDHLLPHDDRLDARKIAYVLNLSEDFTAKDGGNLQFFSVKKKGNSFFPTNVVKSFEPSFNTLFLFQVSKKSYHQVQEVFSEKKRVSIGGWFHEKKI